MNLVGIKISMRASIISGAVPVFLEMVLETVLVDWGTVNVMSATQDQQAQFFAGMVFINIFKLSPWSSASDRQGRGSN